MILTKWWVKFNLQIQKSNDMYDIYNFWLPITLKWSRKYIALAECFKIMT